MAMTTISMVLTVFVLNLHHNTERPIPAWATNVVFVTVAKLMGNCEYNFNAVVVCGCKRNQLLTSNTTRSI